MSQCPHFNAHTQECRLLREVENRSRSSSAAQNRFNMYKMMGMGGNDAKWW